jgi:hypothetical protein
MTLLFRRRAPEARRGQPSVPVMAPAAADFVPLTAYPVRLFTSTHLLSGIVTGRGRLSSLLNAEPSITLAEARSWPIGEPAGTVTVEPAIVLDPFEIELVMTLRLPDATWVRARRVNKLRYPAELAADPFRIEGIVHAFAGADPTTLARHAGGVFLPVTEPVVRRDGRIVTDPRVDAVLVNRHIVRTIELVDAPGAFDATGALLARRALAVS